MPRPPVAPPTEPPPRPPVGPGLIERATQAVTRGIGSVPAFLLACLLVLSWLAGGLSFGFSETWMLLINTGATITTFLMLFLLQRAQNKDTLALQIKLNEVVAALKGASNRLIAVENLSEQELQALADRYHQLATSIKTPEDRARQHTIESVSERP